MNIKMIVMDIDGTLLNSSGNISSKTKSYLIELQEKGVPLVLASGRNKISLDKISKLLKMENYPKNAHILLNGMEIRNAVGEVTYAFKGFKKDDMTHITSVCKELEMDVVLFYEDVLFVVEYGNTKICDGHLNSQTKIHCNDIIVADLLKYGDLKKIAILQDKSYIDKIMTTLVEKVGDKYEVVRVDPDWIEVTPSGVNKGVALSYLAKLKGIEMKNIAAFGNSENDIEMLKVAGISVAMDNSMEHIKEVTKYVCKSNNEDGIVDFLKNTIFE